MVTGNLELSDSGSRSGLNSASGACRKTPSMTRGLFQESSDHVLYTTSDSCEASALRLRDRRRKTPQPPS